MNIRLSKKHGLNASLEQCFLCGKDKGLILFGQLKDDVEAPRQVCLNQEPCDECKGLMAQGIILISIDEKRSTDKSNPYRTGGWVVIREEFVKKAFPEDIQEQVINKRVCFLPDEVWDHFGLPRG